MLRANTLLLDNFFDKFHLLSFAASFAHCDTLNFQEATKQLDVTESVEAMEHEVQDHIAHC